MKARGQLDYYLDGHVKNSPSFSFGWKLVARRSARRKIIAAQRVLLSLFFFLETPTAPAAAASIIPKFSFLAS
jgi:hypothetical protein